MKDKKLFRVIVAGSRGYSDYHKMVETLDHLLSRKEKVNIISGMARGADSLALRYAKERGIRVIEMPAKWDEEGRSAGYRRNERMANVADGCVVFLKGDTPGSQHMVETAKKKNIPLRVIRT